MSPRLYRALQSLVLVLLGLFLLNKLLDGTLFWYINARFLPLTLVGAVGLIWLARSLLAGLRPQAAATPANEPEVGTSDAPSAAGRSLRVVEAQPLHAHATSQPTPLALLVMLLPFVLGVLVPARPLGASAIDNKGLSAVAPRPAAGEQSPLPFPPAPMDRTVLDWLRAFNQAPDPAVYLGQPADLVGFVYHDPRLPPGQFLLARFTLTCCVADASAIGVIVAWPEADRLPTNAWVRVRGPVQVSELQGQPLPLVEAEAVDSVAEPAQPYLYN